MKHPLNTSGRPQTKSPYNSVVWKKKRGKGKGPVPLVGNWCEQRFPHSEKPTHSREISWDRKGPLGDKRKPVYGRQDKERISHMVHNTALHTPA